MLERIANTNLRDLPLRPALRAPMDCTVGDAIERLKRAERDALLVDSPDGHMVGIVTDHDIVRLAASDGGHWRGKSLREVMTGAPRTARATASIGGAIRLMSRYSFRHVPVVGDDGTVLGIVSVRDIITYLAELFPEEFLNRPLDPRLEARGRWGG